MRLYDFLEKLDIFQAVCFAFVKDQRKWQSFRICHRAVSSSSRENLFSVLRCLYTVEIL